MRRKLKVIRQLRENKGICKKGRRAKNNLFQPDHILTERQKKGNEKRVPRFCIPPLRLLFICNKRRHIVQGIYREGDRCPIRGCNGILKMYLK